MDLRLTSSAVLLTLAAVTAAPAFAQNEKDAAQTDAFFKTAKIVHIDVDIPAKPLALIRLQPRTYVRANLIADGAEYPDVGVHLKGAANSYRGIDDKPGFNFNMDRFDATKTFHGMDKWRLHSLVDDPSCLVDLVYDELMRAAGVPGPRLQLAVVTFNGRNLGAYCLLESSDKSFLKRRFKDADGNFYDGGFLHDVDQPLELLRTKTDVKDWADLKALVGAAREPDLKARYEKLDKLLDLDAFVSMFAVQTLVADSDGYASNRNNYRLYHDPKRDKITFIPSGTDHEFGVAVDAPILPPMRGLVATALLQTPEGRGRYLKRVAELNGTIMDPAKWSKRIDELQALVQPELTKIDARAAADYPKQVDRLRAFFRERAKSVERQLKSTK